MIGSQPPLLVLRPDDAPARPRLSIVVPAFNESGRISRLLDGLAAAPVAAEADIVVVDDGSVDDTAQVAQRAGAWTPRLQVLRHETNLGKGAAVRTGVLAARGELVAFLDADNATDLDALGPMCDAIGGQVGAAFGSRHAPGATVEGSPPIRGLMGRVFNHVVRFAAGTSISDTQCGAKVFWGPAAAVAFAESSIDGFAFDVDVLRRLMALGVGVIEYPVHWRYVAGTKIGPLTPVRMLRDIAIIRLRPPRLDLAGLDVLDSSELRNIADPIVPGASLTPGARSRLLAPHLSAEQRRRLPERLSALGVEVMDQARS